MADETNGKLGGKLVIIAAGGTGGHMFPARAFADEMRKRGWRVGLISDSRGLHYATDFPAEWKEEVFAASPNFRKPWTLPGAFLKIQAGIGMAKRIMKDQKPALAAAKAMKVPVLIHEQNAVLGRVNRNMAPSASVIASGFERLDRLPGGKPHKAVGNPVREPILAVREQPYPPTDGKLTLLITGGSQGSQIIGETVPLAIANHIPAPLRARLKVIQQVRAEQLDKVKEIYDKVMVEAELAPFFSDMPEKLAAAHLVIARSGAGTVSELAAVGRPSILIPLAIAMDDHQAANAEALTDVGAADMILEGNLYPALLGELIAARLSDPEELKQRAEAAKSSAKVNAAGDLADLAEAVALH